MFDSTYRKRQPHRRGSWKAARYFGGQARSANDRHQPRVQLWKGDKRRDHSLSWTSAAASHENIAEAGNMLTAREEGHSKRRASADFLPVDPVALPFDGQSPSAEHDGTKTESLEQWVARKTKEFNLETRARPDCEDTWLQFADFQEEVVLALHGSGKKQILDGGCNDHVFSCVSGCITTLLFDPSLHY